MYFLIHRLYLTVAIRDGEAEFLSLGVIESFGRGAAFMETHPVFRFQNNSTSESLSDDKKIQFHSFVWTFLPTAKKINRFTKIIKIKIELVS